MSLYERVGGHPTVRAITDLMYDRFLRDDLLAPYFDGVELRRLRRHQTEFLTWALGGPAEYADTTLRAAHRGRQISDVAFGRFVSELDSVLTDVGIHPATAAEVVAVIERSRPHVVEPGSPRSAPIGPEPVSRG